MRDNPIQSEALRILNELREFIDRPELTDAERVKFQSAGIIIRDGWLDIEDRFVRAPIGSTTFSVLGQ